MTRYLVTLLVMFSMQSSMAADTVFKLTLDAPADEVYDKVYKALEAERFYVVFEPDIGKNIAGFAKRWGENYNRNGLTSLRSMVFCNGWYANEVSNRDPDMLGLCPLHVTVYGRDGNTSVLFNRPTVIAADSPALPVLQELEQTVIQALENSLR